MALQGLRKLVTVLFLASAILVEVSEATGSHCWNHCITYDSAESGPTAGPPINHQGPPGKRGGPGPKGDPGLKGQKGECSGEREALDRLERRLDALNSTNDARVENLTRLLTERMVRLETNLQQSNEVIEVITGAKVLRSCSQIKVEANNMAKSGYFVIRPDPSLFAFSVHCNFTGPDGSVMTTVEHDSQDEIEALPKCEPAQCYHRDIRYRASYQQIAASVTASARCRQFIRWKCLGSVLMISNHGGWKSSDGTARAYWGGSNGKEGFCACGIQGNCVDPTKECNCDRNIGPFYVDEGYLEDKNHLPVASVQFGDLGDDSEHGFHTIGPLQCFS